MIPVTQYYTEQPSRVNRKSTSSFEEHSLIPDLFDSLNKQLQNLCVCSIHSNHPSNMDYSTYFGDMDSTVLDVSLNTGLIAKYEKELYYSGRYEFPTRTIREEGVEESKDDESDCVERRSSPPPSLPLSVHGNTPDESARFRRDFYRRPWFATTAIGFDEDESILIDGTSNKNKMKKIDEECNSSFSSNMRLRPRLFSADKLKMSPSRVLATEQSIEVDGIPLEDESEKLSNQELQKPIMLENVECFLTPALGDLPPPIAPADTETTASMCGSFDSLLDQDNEDEVWLERRTKCNMAYSDCFRTPEPLIQLANPTSPPALERSLYTLLRMRPANYIHGDDKEDDDLFLSLVCNAKQGPPPMMPELR